MYDTILALVDDRDPTNRAIEQALTLADEYGASVHAIYCVETHRYGEPALSSAELLLTRQEERGQALLEDLATRADTAGVEFTSSICHGRPKDVIPREAGELEADLLVVGYQSHGQGQRQRRRRSQRRPQDGAVGNVARRVDRSTDRPIVTA